MTISRRRFLALGAAGAAALGTARPGWFGRPSGGGSRAQGRWTPAPGLPRAAQEVYAAVRDGVIVMAGGMRSSADSSFEFETLEGTAFFDPEAGSWEAGPRLPEPRHHLSMAAVGGTVLGFGGFVGENLRTGFRFRRDVFALGDGRWSREGRMPVPLGESVALAVGGRVHLVTGSLHPENGRPRSASGTHLVYEPDSGAWSEARPAPTPRSSATGAVIDGKLYVVGGRRREGGFENLGALERYDPESDRWDTLRPLPSPAGGLAGASLDGILYCFGGERFGPSGGDVFDESWEYDPAEDEWTATAPMRTPRHGLAAAAVAGRVYAIGGNTAPGVGAATSDVVEALVPSAGG